MKILFLSIIISFAFVSCVGIECKNSNPLFDSISSTTIEYQKELAFLIKNDTLSHLAYFVGEHNQKDKLKNSLNITVKGEKLCAQFKLKFNKPSAKLENIFITNGRGYTGAELSKLKVKMIEHKDSVEFIYTDVDKIVD